MAAAAAGASEAAARDAAAAAKALGVDTPAAPPQVLRALRLLAEQATHGIDYASLGLNWDHPTSRTEYRNGRHASIVRSQTRNEASRAALAGLAARLGGLGAAAAEAALVQAFVGELGQYRGAAAPGATTATFDAVLAALEGELLWPLRALHEGQPSLHTTFNGQPVPPAKVERCVTEILTHVLQGDFSDWRYSNDVGARQLEGLSPEQKAKWAEPTRVEHKGGVVTHEDGPGELGFFWATKIGGPSHGFDFEGQCILPLLANARHKVILVSDPAWPHHPVGRAHFRLLWTAGAGARPPRPRLWLETVNKDFLARVDQRPWLRMVLHHAAGKADAMGVALSVDAYARGELEAVVRERAQGAGAKAGEVGLLSESLALRPSNGVVEASDYLSDKHDWVQLTEEVTSPMRRCIYTPPGAGGTN